MAEEKSFIDKLYDELDYIDYCTILEIQDPVQTPSGNRFYERKRLTEWVGKNHTDPVTRKPLEVDDIKELPEYTKLLIGSVKELIQKNEGLEKKNKSLKENINELINTNQNLAAQINQLKNKNQHSAENNKSLRKNVDAPEKTSFRGGYQHTLFGEKPWYEHSKIPLIAASIVFLASAAYVCFQADTGLSHQCLNILSRIWEKIKSPINNIALKFSNISPENIQQLSNISSSPLLTKK